MGFKSLRANSCDGVMLFVDYLVSGTNEKRCCRYVHGKKIEKRGTDRGNIIQAAQFARHRLVMSLGVNAWLIQGVFLLVPYASII